MGGTALQQKGITTHRISAAAMDAYLWPKVAHGLRTALPGVAFERVRSIADKPDHGDLDVVLDAGALPDDWVARVTDAFRPPAVLSSARNPVVSFPVDNVQVDLIAHRDAPYDFARRYFADNDLGNLVGRIARGLGLKFAHKGLLYPFRDRDNPDHFLADVLVTDAFDDALAILGFDPAPHHRGFDTLDSMLAYVVTSRYFDPAFFDLAKRSHRTRTRDAKRANYRAFLAYIEGMEPSAVAPAPDKATVLWYLRLRRPVFDRRLRAAEDALLAQAAFKRKFNGAFVQAMTGLQGKALGAHMAAIVEAAGGRDALAARLATTGEAQPSDYLLGLSNRVLATRKITYEHQNHDLPYA